MRCGTYSLSSGFLRRPITLCLASVLAFQNFTLFQHDLSFNRTRRVWIVSPTSKGVSYLLMVQHETKHSPRHETTEGSRFRDNSGRTSRQHGCVRTSTWSSQWPNWKGVLNKNTSRSHLHIDNLPSAETSSVTQQCTRWILFIMLESEGLVFRLLSYHDVLCIAFVLHYC